MAEDAWLELARSGLRSMAGLAPSAVLDARLHRAAHLLPRLKPHPQFEEPGWAALLDAATVQETHLFRAPAQLARLEASLPTLLLAARAEGRPLRLLSAGCATGEEAFTLAALALQSAAQHVPGAAIEVLGLDVCRPALQAATAGIIGPHLGQPLHAVPVRHLPWLAGPDGAPCLHPSLRRCLDFRRVNLLALPDGLGIFDVVLCRNVLIYMDGESRGLVLDGLAARLRSAGLLGLGATDAAPRSGFSPEGQAMFRRG